MNAISRRTVVAGAASVVATSIVEATAAEAAPPSRSLAIRGADMTFLPQREEAGVRWSDLTGRRRPAEQILVRAGANTMRSGTPRLSGTHPAAATTCGRNTWVQLLHLEATERHRNFLAAQAFDLAASVTRSLDSSRGGEYHREAGSNGRGTSSPWALSARSERSSVSP